MNEVVLLFFQYARACHYLALRIKVDKPYPTFSYHYIYPSPFLFPPIQTLIFFSLFPLQSSHFLYGESWQQASLGPVL